MSEKFQINIEILPEQVDPNYIAKVKAINAVTMQAIKAIRVVYFIALVVSC